MVLGRKSGILMHPTSLPSAYGIGELGREAYHFIDFLKNSKQTLWQILPLGPVGFGESPYQSFSAFAGNHYLISIEKLLEDDLLEKAEVEPIPSFNTKKVDFENAKKYKDRLFRLAFKRYKQRNAVSEYNSFVADNSFWLEDFAFFMALKNYFGGISWNEWDSSISKREPEAMELYRTKLTEEIELHKFLQYTFFTQWMDLKRYANSKEVRIVGDLPIFISNDSSDAWAQPELFEIDEQGLPTKVAGVPPDYFSETGQFWGNPHYKWDVMKENDYKWWRDRFKLLLGLVDIIRIDHFRGFESYWDIPGSERTAVNGKWTLGPGSDFFKVIKTHMGELPIIAEDLGFITKEVADLKDEFGFPGMKILQFSFGKGAEERFLPHNYEENSIVYTGTHDNDTTVGWYKKSLTDQPEAVKQLLEYLQLDENVDYQTFCWTLIEVAFKSRSNAAIFPLQDILCLDTEARMNIPNTIGGNWDWRFEGQELTSDISEKLVQLSEKYNRNM